MAPARSKSGRKQDAEQLRPQRLSNRVDLNAEVRLDLPQRRHPIRLSSSTDHSRMSSSFSSASARRISSAARTARRASSSCTTGMPKTAITASPMNFSTVPPWASSTVFMRSKYRDMTPRSDSGSSRSPRPVEPLTSQKTIVTVLRTSRAGADGTSSPAPHSEQNLAPSGFSCSQFGQAVTVSV
jgi:hypothetical protein